MTNRSDMALRLLLAVLGLVVGALLSVGLIRAVGVPPGTLLSFLAPPVGWTEVLSIHERDDALGYVLIPGASYQHRTAQFDVLYRVGDRGSRRVPGFAAHRPQLLVVGDSWTFGHGVEDDATYAAKMQQHMPEVGVRNLGVMGYGVLHAMMTVERVLEEDADVEWVVYGWTPVHLHRTYLRESYLRVVAGEHAPWFELEDGELVSRGLANLSGAVPDGSVGLSKKEWSITIAAVEKMAQLVASHGAKFLVVLLPGPERFVAHHLNSAEMAERLERAGVDFIDFEAELPDGKSAEFFIVDDGHPNARWHALVGQALGQELSRVPLQSSGARPAP